MGGTTTQARAQLGDGGTPSPLELVYLWRVRTRLPDRFGQLCAVAARGAMNSCLVRFADGFEVITSRNYLRRRSEAA